MYALQFVYVQECPNRDPNSLVPALPYVTHYDSSDGDTKSSRYSKLESASAQIESASSMKEENLQSSRRYNVLNSTSQDWDTTEDIPMPKLVDIDFPDEE